MIKIALSLGFALLFAFAENCDFSNEAQRECEIDIKNPPLMLHKFANADGKEYSEYRACINGGDIEIDNTRYEVLDCSMVESKDGKLTEGVSLTNGANLLKNKVVTLKQDNILMRVAGDLIIDSGIRLNVKNPKNFVIEIIEGTNTRSNLVLQRGASISINSLIMPEGANSSVWLNTYYGGIYEREFIDMINQKSPASRGGMETLLSVNDMFALSKDGEDVLSFNGNIFCGPEVNPLDLNATDYTLKRLFYTKNNSIAPPNNANAVCSVKEGGCFDNLINFSNQKINTKNYKVATARTKIIPTYDIFIESGKITSKDGRNLASIAPNAKIEEQNYGKCEKPTKVAFEQSVIDGYLVAMGIKKADSTADSSADNKTDSAQKDSADSTQMASDTSTPSASEATTMASANNVAQPKDTHSPINAEIQAELDENIQDLLATFGIETKKDSPKDTKADSSVDTPKVVADSSKKEIEITQDSKATKPSKSAESTKEVESTKPAEVAQKPAESKPTKIAQADEAKKSAESSESTESKADESKDESTQIAQDSSKDLASESKEIADLTPKATAKPKTEAESKPTQIAQAKEPEPKPESKAESKPTKTAQAPKAEPESKPESKADSKAESKPESTAKSAPTEPTKDSQQVASADDEELKQALLEPEPEPQPTRTPKPAGKEEFMIVEQEAYDKLNKECYGDLKCLHKTLQSYDGVVWSKKSSKERQNTLYLVNLTDDNLNLDCEVRNYYGKNIKKSYALSHTNKIGALDLKFATSYDRTQVICKTPRSTKATNKIIVTPASFDLQYNFVNEGSGTIPTLKAGEIQIAFKNSRALTLEGDVDNGFGGNLEVKNLTFTQKNKCDGVENTDIVAPNGMNLRFRKGYLQNSYATISANTIAFGRLNIDFKIVNDDKTCKDGISSLEPQCVGAKITKDISIIPANFRVKTDILADSGSNQITYYGQIDDKHTFRYNPILSVDIEALNDTNTPISINKVCNYGSVELSLKNDKLIEFKRSSSDRLNSRIVAYLRDFEKPAGTNIKAYFGISKIVDKYKNSRTITQSDAVEPSEVTLMDFKFNIRFRNGTSQFDYDNLDVYDRLDENSEPLGILFVRGKLQTNDIKGDLKNSPSLIAKYAIYCKSCDKRILSKYLQSEPEIESQYWYINAKHPSKLYVSDSFIKIPQNSKNRIEILNSNEAQDGRQQITFKGKKSGIYPITIAQRMTEFAPYLNYNGKYKNTYVSNTFNVMISEVGAEQDIISDIKAIKNDNTPSAKPAPNITPTATAVKTQGKDGVWLDIEE